MTVRSILDQKGSDVATGNPSMTIAEVCTRLAERKIGALVMTDPAGAVVGIISERDVVRVMAQGGCDALSDQAAKHMTKTVVTCRRRDTIDEVMEMMTRGRFRHVPVVDDGKLSGIISIGDVVKHRMAEVEREANHLRTYIASA